MGSDIPSDIGPVQVGLAWRVHPLTENAWRSALLTAIIILASAGAWSLSGWPGMAILAFVILIVSMAPFIFPTRYRVDKDGIEIIFLGVRSFRDWGEFRNFYPHDVGVHLSTFRRPSGLDAFRGSFIRFAPGNRGQVLKFLETHIKRETKGSAGKASDEGVVDSSKK